jgi:transposase
MGDALCSHWIEPMNREDAKRWIGFEVRIKPINGAQCWGHGLLTGIEGKCGLVKPHGHGGRVEKVPLKLLKPHKSAYSTAPIRNQMTGLIPRITPIPELPSHGEDRRKPSSTLISGIFKAHKPTVEPPKENPKPKETIVQTQKPQTLTHVKLSNGKPKSRSFLNDEQKFKLWEFLRQDSTKQLIDKERLSVEKIAAISTKHCGFPISSNNINAAVEVLGLSLPRTRRSAPTKSTEADRIIATRLVDLYVELGKDVPDDLRQIASPSEEELRV